MYSTRQRIWFRPVGDRKVQISPLARLLHFMPTLLYLLEYLQSTSPPLMRSCFRSDQTNSLLGPDILIIIGRVVGVGARTDRLSIKRDMTWRGLGKSRQSRVSTCMWLAESFTCSTCIIYFLILRVQQQGVIYYTRTSWGYVLYCTE